MIQNSRKNGFTLIELMLTIAILAGVAIYGSLNLFNYYARQNLNLTVDEIIAFLRDAQSRSLAQESGDQWGVHLSNTTSTKSFQLFHGLDYVSGTVVMSKDLRSGVLFIAPAAGTSTDIIFAKVTGYPNATTSIVLISSWNPNQAYTINISEVGIAAKNFGTLASVPGAPTGLSATAGYQQITLNWSAPNDGGSPITNYEIYRSTSPGGETFLKEIGNVTSTIDTGLTNGTTYYYQVSAKNSKGEGPKSGEVSAVPGDTTPPTAGSHTFRWTYSKDGSVSSGSDTAWVDEVLIQNLDGCINNGNNTGWTF